MLSLPVWNDCAQMHAAWGINKNYKSVWGGIAETGWDSSGGWNTVTDGHVLSKEDVSWGEVVGGSLCQRTTGMLYPGTGKGENNLWVRIKGHANTGDTVVGFHCSPPDQGEEEVDKAFCGRWKLLCVHGPWFSPGTSTTLIFVGRTTRLDTQEIPADHWRKLVPSPFTSVAGSYTDKPGGIGWRCGGWDSPGYCDHEVVELRILLGGSQVVSRTRYLNLQRADFGLWILRPT